MAGTAPQPLTASRNPGSDAGDPRPAVPVTAGSTIATLLRSAASLALPAMEVRILLAHTLQLTRVQLITQSERALDADEAHALSALLQRRLQGEPIAYIVGEREFYGLTLQVNRDVLIPRPETELLVELALERLPLAARVLDMGTGSGAIAIAIAHTRPDLAVAALDVSENALAIARANAARHGTHVRFLRSDWYGGLGDEINRQFDVIVANPPYIVNGDPHLSQGDLRFEPVDALTDHADGLSALRTIIDGAPRHLRAGGWLLMEHGYDQSAAVQHLLSENGWRSVQSWKDLSGIERVTGALL